MDTEKRNRISFSLSLRVFLVCSLFGLIGSVLIFISEQSVILDDQLRLLEEISSSYFREIDNDIREKIISADRANKTIQAVIIDKERQSTWKSGIVKGANGEYRADDGISGAFSSSLQPMNRRLEETFHITGEIWELIAPLMLDKFQNFWIITNDNFIRVSPKNWALEVESDRDLKEHIHYRTGAPENNPERIPQWSPVFFDSVLRSWMTSLIIPIYDGDSFVGVTGSDLPLNNVLAHLDNLENRSMGFKFLIFDKSDNMVLHPDYSLNIPGRDGPMGELLKAENLNDRDLADFIRGFNQGLYGYGELLTYRENGKKIKAFAYPLRLLNWRFIVYREERELRRLALNLGWKIILFTMIIALGIAYLIRYITNKLIIKRLITLVRSIEQFKESRNFVEPDDDRNDEVSLLSRAFKKMGRTINSQLADLSKANRELTGIMESSTVTFIISTDTEGLIREYNKGAEHILGYMKEEMVGINTPGLFHDEEEMISRGKELSALYGEKIEGFSVFTYVPSKEGYEERDWICTRKDGRNIMIHLGVTPIYGDSGEITGYLGMGLDITEKKNQDRKLEELREYLVSIINSISSPILVVNGGLTIVHWNSSALSHLGKDRKSFKDCPVSEVLTDFKDELELIEKAVMDRTIQSRYRKAIFADGQISYWNLLIYPLRGEKETGAVIHLENVTEYIHMQEMMIQSEKMLSVGGLAAGMAHEINNPLAGVMQTLEVMNRRLTEIGDVEANRKAAEESNLPVEALNSYMEKRSIHSMIAVMRESGKRIASIVENMLGFARKSEGQHSLISPEKLIQSSIDLALTDYDLQKNYDFKNIRIDLKCTDHIPAVPCERNKIQQVLLNILQNGAQAMTESGISEPAFTIQCSLDSEAEMVYIEISDNGPGMPEEVRKRVFEPFFTTKEEGVGTGLGLSVSYFIITENHKGEMSVSSTQGGGTTFKIGLPIHNRHDTIHDTDQ